MRYYRFICSIPLLLSATACMQNGPDGCNNVPVVNETYIHKYGVAVPSGFWSESGRDGAVISERADGVVVSQSYSQGILDGESNYTFPHNSQIEKREFYQQGCLVKTIRYYFDGTPKEQVLYDQSLKTILTTSWYSNGTPRSAEQHVEGQHFNGEYYNPQNQCDAEVENYAGTRLVRDDYGQLISSDTIQNGQMVSSTTFHSNQTPKEKIPYQNGSVHGCKVAFHPGGEPDTSQEWVNGKQEGMTVVYQHGERYAEVPYKNGNKHGVEQRYRDGTEVVQEISWQNGLQHGPAVTYVGGTKSVVWYYQGQLVSETDYNFLTNKPVAR